MKTTIVAALLGLTALAGCEHGGGGYATAGYAGPQDDSWNAYANAHRMMQANGTYERRTGATQEPARSIQCVPHADGSVTCY